MWRVFPEHEGQAQVPFQAHFTTASLVALWRALLIIIATWQLSLSFCRGLNLDS